MELISSPIIYNVCSSAMNKNITFHIICQSHKITHSLTLPPSTLSPSPPFPTCSPSPPSPSTYPPSLPKLPLPRSLSPSSSPSPSFPPSHLPLLPLSPSPSLSPFLLLLVFNQLLKLREIILNEPSILLLSPPVPIYPK